MYDIKIVKKEQQKTSNWAGGTTTQIFIYPVDSNYGDRDFLWRLSTAVVELEESSFTRLPGFDRHLMVLEGELKLVHKGHHEAVLKQYQQDRFKGEWDTTSYGRARDFNLMLKEGLEGRLEHFKVADEQELTIRLDEKSHEIGFFCCYCYKGKVSYKIKEQHESLEEGDLLIVSYKDDIQVILENTAQDESSLIAAFMEI